MASRWRRRRMCVLIADASGARPRLRDVSATGAFLETNARPALGASVELHHPEAGAIPAEVRSRRRRRHRHRLRLRRALGRLRARRDRRRHEPAGGLDPLDPVPSDSLHSPARRAGRVRSFASIRASAAAASGGLGVIGDAEPGRLDHRNVVGAVADRERVGERDAARGRAPRAAPASCPRRRRSAGRPCRRAARPRHARTLAIAPRRSRSRPRPGRRSG